MSVTYSQYAINFRLNAVVTAIDLNGNGSLVIYDSSNNVLSTISLAKPSGIVSGGVLTFSGQLIDPAAARTGSAYTASIFDAIGTTIVLGLSVGIPTGAYDIVLSNGLNSTLITAGQTIQLLSAQITGS